MTGSIHDGVISVNVTFSHKYRHFYNSDLVMAVIRIDDYSGVPGGIPLKIVRNTNLKFDMDKPNIYCIGM